MAFISFFWVHCISHLILRLWILHLHSHSNVFSLHFIVLQLTEWDDKEEGKEVTQQWEDDWDDDDVSDDFSLQLRRELESSTDKN